MCVCDDQNFWNSALAQPATLKKNEREREREREREQASWMPNDMVTAGNRAPQVEFPSSVLPVLWMCTTVFAWFTPSWMDCRVWSQVIAFGGGPIAIEAMAHWVRGKTPRKWWIQLVIVHSFFDVYQRVSLWKIVSRDYYLLFPIYGKSKKSCSKPPTSISKVRTPLTQRKSFQISTKPELFFQCLLKKKKHVLAWNGLPIFFGRPLLPYF